MFIGMLLGLISFLFVLYTYTSMGIGSSLGFFGENSAILFGTVSALVMFFGIIFGSIYQRISKKKKRISIKKELFYTFSSPHFWSTLCVAPLVFFSTYALTSEDPMQLSSITLNFQNGFFCQAIFKELFGSRFHANN